MLRSGVGFTREEMKRSIILLIAGLTAGLVAGWLIGAARIQRAAALKRTEAFELFLMTQGESTMYSYFDESPAFAAGALHTYLTHATDYITHESFMDPRHMMFDPRSYLMELAIAHGRIAKLYQSLDRSDRASNHVTTAIALVRRIEPQPDYMPPSITNQASLFQLVEELDLVGKPPESI